MKKITYSQLASWIKKLGKAEASKKFWQEVENGAYPTDISEAHRIDASGHTLYFKNNKSLTVAHAG